MDNISRIFFKDNVLRLAECIAEAEHHRKEWERRTGPDSLTEPFERSESSIQHHAEMWAAWCRSTVTNWRMVSEASGYCKDDAN